LSGRIGLRRPQMSAHGIDLVANRCAGFLRQE